MNAIAVVHTITPRTVDPLGMCTPMASVVAALRGRQVVPLEAAHCERGGRSIALTVDGGDRDALLVAELGLPMTVSVASTLVGATTPWWDELFALVLRPDSAPSHVEIGTITGGYVIELGAGVDPDEHLGWTLATRPIPTQRHRAMHELWSIFVSADVESRSCALRQLRAQLGPLELERTLLTIEELRALAALPNVTIGSHGLTHTSLTRLTHPQRAHELDGARVELEAMTGAPVRTVAYPFGHSDGDVAAEAGRAGYDIGVGRDERRLARDEDCMRLPRIGIAAL